MPPAPHPLTAQPACSQRNCPTVRPRANVLGEKLLIRLISRPVAQQIEIARRQQPQYVLLDLGREVSGKSILDLATLAVESGSRVALNAERPDALAAVDALTALILRRFDEE